MANVAFVITPTSGRTGHINAGQEAARRKASTCGLKASAFTAGAMTKSNATREGGRKEKCKRTRIVPECSELGIEFPTKKYDESFRIGIISTRWNKELVSVMEAKVKEGLKAKQIADEDMVEMQVPGAFELPIAARLMCASQKVDAVICLGVLIKGETDHYEYIASAVSSGLMDLQLQLSIPMIFGVLCCSTAAQAQARSTGEQSHAGTWADTAVEMANLRKSQMGGVSAGKKSVGFF